jgi:CBS domain-containing protein
MRDCMKVETCMSKDVQITSPAQSIRDAARIMKEIDAGFLPVGENNRLVGTVTDRDIAVRGVAVGKGPDTPVGDVMSGGVLFCFEDEELDAVSTKMGVLQVRRLPVLNRNKRLVGIISLGDISQAEDDDGARCCAAALSGVSTPGGHHVQ